MLLLSNSKLYKLSSDINFVLIKFDLLASHYVGNCLTILLQ